MMENFHFLRPWWLLAFPASLAVIAMIRRSSNPEAVWRNIIAPQLLPYLVRSADSRPQQLPFVLMALCAAIGMLVLAGPSWRKEKSPFADDVAALVVMVKVTPSMKTEDVPPDRLTRGIEKLHDLLARRGDGKTALVAYAGSAHLVMPPTVDPGIINTFAEALDPAIMPVEGDSPAEALALASTTLAGSGGGSILWITDDVAPDQIEAVKQWRKTNDSPVRILAPLSDVSPVRAAADASQAKIIAITPDDSDVDELAKAAKFAPTYPAEGGERWKDDGYFLTPLLALLYLPFFRKGWMPAIAAKS